MPKIMRWLLKCYYGYQNRWDELLLFGVLDWIKNHTNTIHIAIQAWNIDRMQTWCSRHKDILDTIGLEYSIVGIKENKKQYDLFFFGGWEVINDQDSYILPPNASIKHYIYYFLSKFFTRSWRNYLLQYRKAIWQSKFFLLGGIGKPYKFTTRQLYNILLPKAKGIVTRDTSSYQLALAYNPHTTLYHDFSQYMIEKFRQTINSHPVPWHGIQYITTKNIFKKTKPIDSGSNTTAPKWQDARSLSASGALEARSQLLAASSTYPADSYILINTQDHIRSDKVLVDIQAFVDKYPKKTPIYFPCDMNDDSKYFDILAKYIPDLQFYDRTKYSVSTTLALFAHAHAGIGSRLHFLYPLHSFGKKYTSIATKDKVAKLLSPTPIDAL